MMATGFAGHGANLSYMCHWPESRVTSQPTRQAASE
jgi:hypothetical protein